MTADENAWESCAAFGCPMLGSFGVSGKWYCCCHFRSPASANDAITSVLVQHRPIVDALVLARRQFTGYAEIKRLEDQLVELTHEIGKQYSVPRAGVTGPTHSEPHFSEADE